MSSAVSCWRAFDTTIWCCLISNPSASVSSPCLEEWVNVVDSWPSFPTILQKLILWVFLLSYRLCTSFPGHAKWRSWICQGVGKIVGCVGESVQVLFDEKQYQWLMVGFNQKGFSQEIAWNVSHAHVVARTSFSILCTSALSLYEWARRIGHWFPLGSCRLHKNWSHPIRWHIFHWSFSFVVHQYTVGPAWSP